MSESSRNTVRTKPKTSKIAKDKGPVEDRMEDEEKILAGRLDVNYPALLTKDVPGG